jgi:Sap, sulfolipid-1-addressing protein
MTFLRIVPMAFVMVAGPQIISSVVFATSERARANSVAYVSGAVTSTIVGTTLFFILWEALGFKSATISGGHVYVDWTLVGLLAILAVRVYLRRAEAEPPKWMGKLQTASPSFALKLGLLLFIAMPTDILTMLAVSGYLSTHDESLANAIPFFLLTALLIGFPCWCSWRWAAERRQPCRRCATG